MNNLKEIPIKIAIEDGESFYKLTIKIKDEIVAYGISNDDYDMLEEMIYPQKFLMKN